MTTTWQTTPRAPVPDVTVHEDLTRLVFDGMFEAVHQDLRTAVMDPIFDHREGLTMTEAAQLAYQRVRFIRNSIEPAVDIVRNPQRLFALSEWPSLLDTTTLPLLGVSYNLCLGSILQHGTGRDDLDDYIRELSTSAIGMYMVTELGYGNNAAALETEAIYDHQNQEFIINTPRRKAQKFMPYSGIYNIPKLAVVMARLKVDSKDHGIFPFIVRITDQNGAMPGVHIAPCPEKPGLALDNGMTWFDHIRIPRRNLLTGVMGELTPDGRFRSTIANKRTRFLATIDRVHPGRICLANALVAAGRASVYIAVRYSFQRLTSAPGHGEQPIIVYRSHQIALFTALAQVYAMTFLLNHVKREFTARTTENAHDINRLISVTKAISSWQMSDIINVCRERCGAQGMFGVNRIADYVSMAQGVVTAEGDNLPLLATAASGLLARHNEWSSVKPPDPRSHNLLDRAFHIDLLRYHEDGLRRTTRDAIAYETCHLATLASAWNHNMNAALKAARIHGVRLALEQFHAASDNARTAEVSSALSTLASLYALTEISGDTGWYLAKNALTSDQVEQLPTVIDDLCEQILPHAENLIAGFNLTPELLRAPIATDDYLTVFNELFGAWKDGGPQS